ncbi:hypothetical protein HED51_11340 [Ochrobactrum grignonense]|nr:hypothetical protein [Brucella grignonensis]
MPPAHELLPVKNGLLHLPSGKLYQPSPAYFCLNAADVKFDPNAPKPKEWLRFLDQVWPGDTQSIEALQDMFGYLLSPDTSQQKVFLIVGPKRSGKGTIARVLTGIMGQDSVAAPTLASLATNFGLAPLIGKSVAMIGDARLSGRADQASIAERLLSISGEDSITVDRKFKPAWTGRLSARFVILTNELPRLADASGALASRFVVLTMEQSFYGREDMRAAGTDAGDLKEAFEIVRHSAGMVPPTHEQREASFNEGMTAVQQSGISDADLSAARQFIADLEIVSPGVVRSLNAHGAGNDIRLIRKAVAEARRRGY